MNKVHDIDDSHKSQPLSKSTMATPLASGIIPAQLGFLAIYNPSLGATDETVDDQIVYYASASTHASSKRRRHRSAKDARPTDAADNDDRNERLRQIGLAQGMVEFGRSFSSGKAVDSIDTERSRVVLHELEPGWWILAVCHLPYPITTNTQLITLPPVHRPHAHPPPPRQNTLHLTPSTRNQTPRHHHHHPLPPVTPTPRTRTRPPKIRPHNPRRQTPRPPPVQPPPRAHPLPTPPRPLPLPPLLHHPLQRAIHGPAIPLLGPLGEHMAGAAAWQPCV